MLTALKSEMNSKLTGRMMKERTGQSLKFQAKGVFREGIALKRTRTD